jgi:hypothetical protein
MVRCQAAVAACSCAATVAAFLVCFVLPGTRTFPGRLAKRAKAAAIGGKSIDQQRKKPNDGFVATPWPLGGTQRGRPNRTVR